MLIGLGIGFWVYGEKLGPPKPKVMIDGDEIPFTQGSYCWTGLFSAKCVDMHYGGPFEMGTKHRPTAVSPNGEIRIQFQEPPLKGMLKITQWSDENNMQLVPAQNGKIKVPNEEGIFVYEIEARWSGGSSSYAFSIEVK